MTFKTLTHVYKLLKIELSEENEKFEEASENVNKAKDLTDSCWTTNEEIEYWKKVKRACSDRIDEIEAMIEEIENMKI